LIIAPVIGINEIISAHATYFTKKYPGISEIHTRPLKKHSPN
jgi:hypothetical protein